MQPLADNIFPKIIFVVKTQKSSHFPTWPFSIHEKTRTCFAVRDSIKLTKQCLFSWLILILNVLIYCKNMLPNNSKGKSMSFKTLK